MASTSFLHSQIPLSKPFSSTHRNSGCTKIFAIRRETHDQNFDGRMVDENLIILRKRIHEMKVIERNYEPPSEWMDWEKRFYANYDSIICDAMGLLQSQLMETRPSLALGIIALIALSLPTSTGVIMFHLIDIIKGIIHLGG
ncbi:Mediator of RNA polymerase II transcription subunit 18 [Olea europaea subsp. europaea]|uniref:Mediator of RNA polymerase II transcription subunit 18 n=1 Tax=Olea europaea subsp. europaea TaxID=158383 RepID=A0A8S0PA24_OLEEU|nr:Mediator of RNA polymerase II transcription subunit 18 [Olea europaea subsp. europaea]